MWKPLKLLIKKIEDYHKLDKVLYAFYEAARMFPAVYVMIREAMEDTTLTVPNPPGMEGSAATLSVRKGTKVRPIFRV